MGASKIDRQDPWRWQLTTGIQEWEEKTTDEVQGGGQLQCEKACIQETCNGSMGRRSTTVTFYGVTRALRGKLEETKQYDRISRQVSFRETLKK